MRSKLLRFVFCFCILVLGAYVIAEVFGRRLPNVHTDIRALESAMLGKIKACQLNSPTLWKNLSEKRQRLTNSLSDDEWFIDSNNKHIIVMRGTNNKHTMIDVNCCKRLK